MTLERLGAPHLRALARGCALLGAGGGGDPAVSLAMALHAVRRHGPVRVVALQQLAGDALVMPCGRVGSPAVAEERLWSGDEGRVLCELVERRRGRPVAALMPFEIGGANGLLPVTWAARLGLPLVDADGMGRTFPALRQQAMHLAGIPAAPVALADGRGNAQLVEAADDGWAERLARAAAASMGGVCAAAMYTMTAGQARTAAVAGSISRAHALGERLPRGLTLLIEGRVVDLERDRDGGWATVGDGPRRLRLELRGAYVLALEDGAVRAAVPDVIHVLSGDGGDPIPADALRHGLPVAVVALPAPAIWHSPAGLSLGGPAAFGYDVDHAPIDG
jgi:hypothetical protein